MKNQDFCPLHLYSSYSFMDSTCQPAETAVALRTAGHRYAGITDRVVLNGEMYGALHGAPEIDSLFRSCGIKPIFGIEIMLTHSSGHAPLILLAKTIKGFFNLSAIISHQYASGQAVLSLDELNPFRRGLIGLSGGTHGGISRLCAAGRTKDALQLAKELSALFGKDRFYLEIQNHGLPDEPSINHQLRSISQQTGVPIVSTRSIHYIFDSDHPALDLISPARPESMTLPRNEMMSIITVDNETDNDTPAPETIKTGDEIAKRCNVKLEGCLRGLRPAFAINDDPGFHSNLEYLLFLASHRLKKRYEGAEPQQHEKAYGKLMHEILMAQATDSVDQFLIVQDIVQWAKKQGIACGLGWDKEAGSVLAYVLGITEIDPIRFNLEYNRFRPGCSERPRFVLEFCKERHADVLEYIRSRYGADCVGRMICFRRLTPRRLLRDIGQKIGCSATQIQQLSDAIPSRTIDLNEAHKNSPEFRAACEGSPEVELLARQARRLDRLPCATGMHPCALALSRQPLKRSVPVRTNEPDGFPVIQFSKQNLWYLGMMVIDVMTAPHLTRIRRVLERISQDGFATPDLMHLPEDDHKTFKLLYDGHTSNIYGLFAQASQKDLLKEHKPANLDELINLLGPPPDHPDRAHRVSVILQAYHMAYLKAHYSKQWNEFREEAICN